MALAFGNIFKRPDAPFCWLFRIKRHSLQPDPDETAVLAAHLKLGVVGQTRGKQRVGINPQLHI